jgi:hypothetical protein
MPKLLSAAAAAAVLTFWASPDWSQTSPSCGPGGIPRGYPTFCSIPQIPTNVRPPEAFKSAVVETRRAGRQLVQQNAAAPTSLGFGEAEDFAEHARTYAAPPPPEVEPALDTSAFEAEARRRVAVPPKPRS